jgi:lysozyme
MLTLPAPGAAAGAGKNIGDATGLSAGSTSGSIQSDIQDDWYVFTATGSGSVVVKVTNTSASTVNCPLIFVLHDTNGSNKDNLTLNSNLSQTLHGASRAGRYFVEVLGNGCPRAGDPPAQYTVELSGAVGTPPVTQLGAVTAGKSIGDAFLLKGEVDYSATISNRVQDDWYKFFFNGSVPRLYVRLENTSNNQQNCPLIWVLHDSNGTQLDNKTLGPNHAYTTSVATSGTYYVDVHGNGCPRNADPPAEYQLRLDPASGVSEPLTGGATTTTTTTTPPPPPKTGRPPLTGGVRQVDAAGLRFTLGREGGRDRRTGLYLPYNDNPRNLRHSNCTISGHVIAFGKTCAAVRKKPEFARYFRGLTAGEVLALGQRDLGRFANMVNRRIRRPLNQNQFNALVDFLYNYGGAGLNCNGLAQKINAGNFVGAANTIRGCLGRAARDRRLRQGLINRRRREANLFLRPPGSR